MAYIGKQPKKLGAGDDLPSQAGQSGKFLKSDGTNYSWADSDGSPSIVDNGNATAITISSSENVGIGTTSPSAKLHIKSASDAIARFEQTGGGWNYLEFASDSTRKGYLGLDSVGNLHFGSDDSKGMQFWSGGSYRLKIDSNGNMGIGTTSPTFGGGGGLHIKNSSQANVRLDDEGSYFDLAMQLGHGYLINRTSAGSIQAWTNNTERLRIDSSGNVGIGVSAPDSKLQIANNDGSSYRFGYGGSSDVYLDADNVYFRTRTGGANQMTLTTTGLGIGITSPSAKLEVSGGEAYFSNGTYGTKLSYSVGNQTGVIDTFGNHGLEFRTNNTERLRIDSSGRVTMPNQPAFSAKSSSGGNNAASGVQIFATVDTNIGGHFSASTGKFTAPVSGMYHFSGTILSRSNAWGRLDFQKNGSSIRHAENTRATSYYDSVTSTLSLYLNVNDYVNVHSSYGTYGSSYNYFSGFLIG